MREQGGGSAQLRALLGKPLGEALGSQREEKGESFGGVRSGALRGGRSLPAAGRHLRHLPSRGGSAPPRGRRTLPCCFSAVSPRW